MKLPEEELDLLNRLQHKPGEKIQHAYITAAQGLAYATVNQMMEARRLPLLTSQQQSGASDWLKCAPFTKELHLSPEEYCWSVEKLLGMHTTFDETAASCTSCTTTQTKEDKWDHAASCKIGGMLIARHNAFLYMLAKLLKLVGYSVAVEERAVYEGTGNGGPDITVTNMPVEGEKTFVEVSVTNPTVHGAAAAATPLRAAKIVSDAKMKKYRQVAASNGMQLRTAVFESTGALGIDTRSLLKDIVARGESVGKTMVPQQAPYLSDTPKKYIWQMSSVLMRKMEYAHAEKVHHTVPASNVRKASTRVTHVKNPHRKAPQAMWRTLPDLRRVGHESDAEESVTTIVPAMEDVEMEVEEPDAGMASAPGGRMVNTVSAQSSSAQ